MTGDVYDANGNTISTGGQGITYDFENHILTENGATYQYDGDGNRVRKTVGGITTSYAITSVATSVNPEGLPLVGYEGITGFGGHDSYRYWVLGLRREAQYRQPSSGAVEKSYYVYDGHGSARALTDASGNITDTYDYDAFGNLIHSATTLSSATPNEFLFAGEQYDTETGHYYNRARYLNTSTGRFMTMDTVDGDPFSPFSLHRYLYTSMDPVDRIDPTGQDDLGDITAAVGEGESIDALEAQADSLATRVFQTLTSRGATFAVLGTASATILEFQQLANAFEENDGMVVELQDELFAIRYVANQAAADGLWWGTQLFESAQEAINALALDPRFGNTAREIVFGVIPAGAQMIAGYAASQGELAGGAFQILVDAQTLMEMTITGGS